MAYSVGAAGLIATALMTDPVLTMTMLVVAAIGHSSTAPTFWSLPTAMLSGTAAAGGIALINALGNLGGFFGPYAFGLIKDATGGSFTYGLMVLALGPIVSATIVLALGHDRRLEHIPHAMSLRDDKACPEGRLPLAPRLYFASRTLKKSFSAEGGSVDFRPSPPAPHRYRPMSNTRHCPDTPRRGA